MLVDSKKRYNMTTNTEKTLLTIGYEGESIDTFVNTLRENDVRILCDIRRNPISRKPGFSKNKLACALDSTGINYMHIPQLGIDSNRRKNLKTTEDYRALLAEYKKELPTHKLYLAELFRLLSTRERVAIMCFEKDTDMCHRSVVANYMIEKYGIESADLP
jgi:uncharacterized protein (DUF488 family)